MFRFEKLEVWQLSMSYANKVYITTDTFPKNELFGLTLQIKRASLSISSNIAEGSGSTSVAGFCNYLDIAIKSALETVSQLLFARMRNYITEQQLKELYDDAETLIKRIHGLKAYLKRTERKTK